MPYVEDNLSAGEAIIYKASVHWAAFIWPGILLIVGLISWAGIGFGGFVFFGIVATLFILGVLSRELAVTDKRVIGKAGLFRRDSLELRHDRVEAITVDQNILGRMLGYGRITVRGTGGSRLGIGAIANPLAFRKHVDAAGEAAGSTIGKTPI